jgi:hypothetical protein
MSTSAVEMKSMVAALPRSIRACKRLRGSGGRGDPTNKPNREQDTYPHHERR